MSSPYRRRVPCTDLAARARACAMGMRPGRRALRASLCSTQNWGLAVERLIQGVYPIFPCFQPDILIGAHTHGTHSGASKVGLAGCCDALSWRAGGLAGGRTGGRAVLTACMCPQTPGRSCRHPHTHFNALHIQELLPHHSIGLQPYFYPKKTSKPCFSALFRCPKAVGEPAKYTKLCGFVYLAKTWTIYILFLFFCSDISC